MPESQNHKYVNYFDIDEKYFSSIDDSAIAGGARWDITYPHKTFRQLLRSAERMLGGNTARSIWIHGAYGTGKSQCAYALRKILEVPEKELRDYWKRYKKELEQESDLLDKLIGHRQRGIVTVYKYATGNITTPPMFFSEIQQGVSAAIQNNERIKDKGLNSLKENIIAWLEQKEQKDFFDSLLQKPEYKASFSEANADEVLNKLKESSDIKNLMHNIFRLAQNEGIDAMKIDADRLKNWLKDIINKNQIKIVFFWDEFSDFFKNNKNWLGEFQKIADLCQECPFYLVIITHQSSSIIDSSNNEAWKIVQQRFNQIEITLPDNIAFQLIGHAFTIKEEAKGTWQTYADALNARLDASRTAVMKAANIDSDAIRKIMPLHPMAALVLKNIAAAFASNQRSMFDFIKVKDDSHAFQWFITNTGPQDDHPLLTIDMLWDFFYEKGRDNLSPDIRMILDTYPQQTGLGEEEERVLKTILIMQAINQRLGGTIDILKPTEKNISYAFEGISSGSGLDSGCRNVAKNLRNNGILISTPISSGQNMYKAAALAGDQHKIEQEKETIRKASTTRKLVSEGILSDCLSLTPQLKLRFVEDPKIGIRPVTDADFKKVISSLAQNQQASWRFNAVMAFAKDALEGSNLRQQIKKTFQDESDKNIIIIDATNTLIEEDELAQYISYSAMANYYTANNNTSSKENQRAAEKILLNWKNRISNGKFTVWSKDDPNGEDMWGHEVVNKLQTIILKKFPMVPDFNKGLTEAQFNTNNPIAAALSGINQETKGILRNAEKYTLEHVWKIENYWTKSETSQDNISIIKRSIEQLIETLFEKKNGFSIWDIYDHLVFYYGFAPSNLTAFLMGFLLKEYGIEKYRYNDLYGAQGPMNDNKLAELIGDCIKDKERSKTTRIIKMTDDERAFYKITNDAWEIEEDTKSIQEAANRVKIKMQNLRLPIWCLRYIVENRTLHEYIEKYIQLVQATGEDAYRIAKDIGSESKKNTAIGKLLKDQFTPENCRRGMLCFIKDFDEGIIYKLAREININKSDLLGDISDLFQVENSSLWNFETGKDQLRRLITKYKYIKITNHILDASVRSESEADKKWKNKLKFAMCSSEAIKEKFPHLDEIMDLLKDLTDDEEFPPEKRRKFTVDLIHDSAALKNYFENEIKIFCEIYKQYLEGLDIKDISELPKGDLIDIFKQSKSASNHIVMERVDKYRNSLVKTQLRNLWQERTKTRSPKEWSAKNYTPILQLVAKEKYDDARKTFDTINKIDAEESSSDRDLNEALSFLNDTDNADLLADLNDQNKIDEAFRNWLKPYDLVLTDIETVRKKLHELPIDAYIWNSHPSIRDKIQTLARTEYNARGNETAKQKIISMDGDELKHHLLSLIESNMILGLEIIKMK